MKTEGEDDASMGHSVMSWNIYSGLVAHSDTQKTSFDKRNLKKRSVDAKMTM